MAQKNPEKIALSTELEKVSYGEFWRSIVQKSALIISTSSPIKDGTLPQVVCLQAQSKVNFVVDFFSYLNAGHAVCLASHETMEKKFGKNWPVQIHPDARLLLQTSGSMGDAKLVQLSTLNLNSSLEALREAISFETFSSQILFLPLDYSFGLLGQLLPALAAGCETQLCDSLAKLKRVLEQIQNVLISGVPKHADFWIEFFTRVPHLAKKITGIIVAGGALSMEQRTRLKSTVPSRIWVGYGQTEASSRIFMIDDSSPKYWQGATGFPVGRWECKISSDSELLVRGPARMIGYFGAEPMDTEGWLCTGDFGSLDEEGCFTFGHRSDCVVKICGKKISLELLRTQVLQIFGVEDCRIKSLADTISIKFVGNLSVQEILETLRVRYDSGICNSFQFEHAESLNYSARGKPIEI